MDGPAALRLTTVIFTITYLGLALGKVPVCGWTGPAWRSSARR